MIAHPAFWDVCGAFAQQLVLDWAFTQQQQQHLGLDHRTHSYVAQVALLQGQSQPVSASLSR